MKNLLIITAILLTATNSLVSQIINIPEDYPTIQKGIDVANNGDTVLVAPGTYVENLYNNSKNIVLASWYLTTLDTSYISQTVIDGNQNGSVVHFNNCYMNESFQIHGFTITNGYAIYGGGIYASYGSSDLILSNLLIINNYAQEGGGLKCYHWDINLDNVRFINNEADKYGGGLYCSSSRLVGHNVTISNNHSGEEGGGFHHFNEDFWLYDSKFENNSSKEGGGLYLSFNGSYNLENVKVMGNTASKDGGGIFMAYSWRTEFLNVEIGNNHARCGGGMYAYSPFYDTNTNYVNLLVHDNVATKFGGGIFLQYTDFNGINNTIANNEAEDGMDIYFYNDVILSLENSIIFSLSPQQIVCGATGAPSTITVSNSLITGGQNSIQTNENATVNWLEGNINQNPEFVYSGEHPYKVTYNSPCVDAGSVDTTGITEFDLAGAPRLFNNHIDMGAYEWNILVGIEESVLSSSKWDISTNPNPFTTTTTFSYNLQQTSTVQITIFNHLGEEIEVIRQQQPSGKQQVIWNAEGLPTGVYYYRMEAGEQMTSGKMMLVR